MAGPALNLRRVTLSPGLYLVGTPIGNARDITLRALDVLASAEVLAAEDTRSLRHLLDIHGIPLGGRRPLAYHDHSGPRARARLLEALEAGRAVAFAAEAGMPLIADPGHDLVRTAVAAGHMVTCVPGPSAVPTALALAGLGTDAFLFAGFLPAAAAARRRRLEALRAVPGTLVFFESPRRIAASLADMAQILGGGRPAALCRELTKKFEEIRRASLQELADSAASDPPRGEIVLVVERQRSEKIREEDLVSDLKQALRDHSLRDAAEIVAGMHGLPRRRVYQMALRLAED